MVGGIVGINFKSGAQNQIGILGAYKRHDRSRITAISAQKIVTAPNSELLQYPLDRSLAVIFGLQRFYHGAIARIEGGQPVAGSMACGRIGERDVGTRA
jgi:hypothetical protein